MYVSFYGIVHNLYRIEYYSIRYRYSTCVSIVNYKSIVETVYNYITKLVCNLVCYCMSTLLNGNALQKYKRYRILSLT